MTFTTAQLYNNIMVILDKNRFAPCNILERNNTVSRFLSLELVATY